MMMKIRRGVVKLNVLLEAVVLAVVLYVLMNSSKWW